MAVTTKSDGVTPSAPTPGTGGFGRAALLLSFGLLAACATDGPPPPCPQVDVINGLHINEGTGGADGNLQYRAEFRPVTGQCLYDERGITLDLTILIDLEQGPAQAAGTVSLPYFIVVEDPEGDLIGGTRLTAELALAGDGAQTVGIEEIQQSIAGVTPQNAANYQIMVGFDLDDQTALEQRSLILGR